MRSELWGMVFLGFFFLLSCEHAKTPTGPIDLGDIKVLKRGVQESVKSYLTRIAVSLAQDDVWLDKDIRERLAAGESVSLLEMTLPIPLADSTESRVVEEGKTFEIRVELYFDGQAPKILTNNFTEYRVALDPDIFFTRQSVRCLRN